MSVLNLISMRLSDTGESFIFIFVGVNVHIYSYYSNFLGLQGINFVGSKFYFAN